MPKLCFSGWKVDKSEAVLDFTRQVSYPYLPNVGAIADRLEAAYQMRGNMDYRKRARDGALAYDVRKLVEKYWADIPDAPSMFVLEPYFPPGAGWKYSNTNYLLLGMIATEATGSTISGELRSRFWEPLEMSDTFLMVEEEIIGVVAHGWSIRACVATDAIPMISLRAYGGLESYTTQQIISFADFLAGLNVAILLRWNHEMNGSWHAWAQQPTLYVQKFQEFAGIIHERAPNVAILWTPNQLGLSMAGPRVLDSANRP